MILGCKMSSTMGVAARVVVERGGVKWVCIKCMRLRVLAVCLSWLGFLFREKEGN